MKKYTGVYILSDKIRDDDVEAGIKSIRAEIEKAGGIVHDEKNVGMRTFARPMKKQQSGHCVEVGFELDPATVSALQARHRLNETIFRVMIVVAEKESPVAVTETGAAGAGQEVTSSGDNE